MCTTTTISATTSSSTSTSTIYRVCSEKSPWCSLLITVTMLMWFQFWSGPRSVLHLGDFVALYLIRDGSPGFSWWPGWICLCAFELIFSWRHKECMLVGRSKWVGPHLGGGWFQVLVWTQVCTALGDFVTLRLIRGYALGPLESSALGGKTSSPYGKVR